MAKKKKRKGSGFFSNLLLILCILIFCVAAWKLWGYYRHYHGGKKEYEQLRQYVKENADPAEQKKKKGKGTKQKKLMLTRQILMRVQS